MALRLERFIDLPPSRANGGDGFDHAAVHAASHRLYVAHTANDEVDVIDTAADCYVTSVAGLRGVAGALVDEASSLVFTSNREEATVGVFEVGGESQVAKISVSPRPNGLAYDPKTKNPSRRW